LSFITPFFDPHAAKVRRIPNSDSASAFFCIKPRPIVPLHIVQHVRYSQNPASSQQTTDSHLWPKSGLYPEQSSTTPHCAIPKQARRKAQSNAGLWLTMPSTTHLAKFQRHVSTISDSTHWGVTTSQTANRKICPLKSGKMRQD
jgi:hypothetical protein